MAQTTDRKPGSGRTLNRYTKRIFLPTFVAGIAAIILFVAITRKEYRTVTLDAEYGATEPASPGVTIVQTDALANTEAVITSLQPQMQVLSRKIEALEEADSDSWKNQRDEVVEAWDTFDTTYKAIRNTIPSDS